LGRKKDKKRDEEFFGEKREASYINKTKKEKAKASVGREKQRLRSLHIEEEESSSSPGNHRCFFLSTATKSNGSNRQQNQGERE
jgi:hypothetical protein